MHLPSSVFNLSRKKTLLQLQKQTHRHNRSIFYQSTLFDHPLLYIYIKIAT